MAANTADIWNKAVQRARANQDPNAETLAMKRRWAALAEYLSDDERTQVAREDPQTAVVHFPQLIDKRILGQCALKYPGDAITFALDYLPRDILRECALLCPWHALERAHDHLDEELLMDLALEYPWLAINRCRHRFSGKQMDKIYFALTHNIGSK